MYEATTDASRRNGKCGIGFAIKYNGETIHTFRKPIKQDDNVNNLEREALFYLLSYLDYYKITNVAIKTDSQAIIKGLEKYQKEKNKAKSKKKYRYIASQLEKSNSFLMWFPRKENHLAHSLSRETTTKTFDQSKFEVPDFIFEYKMQLKRRQKLKHETKMVVKHRKQIFLTCPSCREKKPATHFPRYKVSNERRICFACNDTLSMLSTLKTDRGVCLKNEKSFTTI